MHALHAKMPQELLYKLAPLFTDMAAKPITVGQIATKCRSSRNAVGAAVDFLATFGLLEVEEKGRSKLVRALPSAKYYASLLTKDFEPVLRTIKSTIESIVPEKLPRQKLAASEYLSQLIAALDLAKGSIERSAPEFQVFEDVRTRLQRARFALAEPNMLFSRDVTDKLVAKKIIKEELVAAVEDFISQNPDEIARAELERAKEILESVAEAAKIAREMKLKPVELEKTGIKVRGKPVYRVK